MSLFKCASCGCVENTACCGIVWEFAPCPGPDFHGDPAQHPDPPTDCWRCKGAWRVKRRRLVCSECNPEIGKWHGRFPKQDADEAGYVPIGDGSRYIERKADG